MILRLINMQDFVVLIHLLQKRPGLFKLIIVMDKEVKFLLCKIFLGHFLLLHSLVFLI